MTKMIGINAKMGFLTKEHDLSDTIVKVRRREILYHSTESVKRQPVMTHEAQISKTFINQKCHLTCVQGLIKYTNVVRRSQNCILRKRLV